MSLELRYPEEDFSKRSFLLLVSRLCKVESRTKRSLIYRSIGRDCFPLGFSPRNLRPEEKVSSQRREPRPCTSQEKGRFSTLRVPFVRRSLTQRYLKRISRVTARICHSLAKQCPPPLPPSSSKRYHSIASKEISVHRNLEDSDLKRVRAFEGATRCHPRRLHRRTGAIGPIVRSAEAAKRVRVTRNSVRHSSLLHAAKIGRSVTSDDKFLREGREEDCITPRSLPTSITTFQPSYPFSCARAHPHPRLSSHCPFSPSRCFSHLFFRDMSPRHRYLIKGCPTTFFYRGHLRLGRAYDSIPSSLVPASGVEKGSHAVCRATSIRARLFSLSLFFPSEGLCKAGSAGRRPGH